MARFTLLQEFDNEAELIAGIAKLTGATAITTEPEPVKKTTKKKTAKKTAKKTTKVPSVDDLKAAIHEAIKGPEGRDAVKAVLERNGAAKVSDVEDEQRATIIEQLGALTNGAPVDDEIMA